MFEGNETNKSPLLSVAYFPAFRTMIEAWTVRELGNDPPPLRWRSRLRRRTDITEFARELFGKFVPKLDYSPPIDIEMQLLQSIAQASLEMADKDRELLAQAILNVLPVLSEIRENVEDPNKTLEDIKSQLDSLEVHRYGSRTAPTSGIYTKLKEMFHSFNKFPEESNQVAARVLNIYKELLTERSTAQVNAFEKIDKYLKSVNYFLEGKQIEVIAVDSGRITFGVRVKNNNGKTSDLISLSSGERQILTLIYAATYMSGRQVVLIDEPELSLHVDWQRSLLKRMSEQLANTQIIVCTHSPIIPVDYEDRMKNLTNNTTTHTVAHQITHDSEGGKNGPL